MHLLAKEADINSKIKVYTGSNNKDTGANFINVGMLVINNKYITKKKNCCSYNYVNLEIQYN